MGVIEPLTPPAARTQQLALQAKNCLIILQKAFDYSAALWCNALKTQHMIQVAVTHRAPVFLHVLIINYKLK